MKKPRHIQPREYIPGRAYGRPISELTRKDKIAFLDSFDIVISSVEGVITKFDVPYPDAGEALMLLKAANKKVVFVTSSSRLHDDDMIQLFRSVGINDVKSDDIVYPAKTISQYLSRLYAGLPVFSLCCQEANEVLMKHNIPVISASNPNVKLTERNMVEHFNSIQNDKVCAVISDFNINITYGEIALAFEFLRNDGVALIGASSDAFIPISHNITIMGNAGFLDLLRMHLKKDVILLGKPGHFLCEELHSYFKITNPGRVLLVGGNLIKDIHFGQHCGFQTLFVFTGHSTKEQMLKLSDPLKPDYVAKSIMDFIPFFRSLRASVFT